MLSYLQNFRHYTQYNATLRLDTAYMQERNEVCPTNRKLLDARNLRGVSNYKSVKDKIAFFLTDGMSDFKF